jgi:hypothetical protein
LYTERDDAAELLFRHYEPYEQARRFSLLANLGVRVRFTNHQNKETSTRLAYLFWYTERDSNPRPPDPKSGALSS